MAAAFSLGQYVSKASIVHRLDARAKIVLVVAYAVALFLAAGWLGVGVCGALLVAGYGAARTHLRSTRIRRADSVAASLGVVLLACVAMFL